MAACGDGVLEPGEWCFDRLSVDIEELGLEQAFRVVATQDGLIVWGDNGFSLLSLDGDTPTFADEPFYWGSYRPGSVIFRAKLSSLGMGRPDLLYWEPLDYSAKYDPSLRAQFVYLSPGASRPEPGSDFGLHDITEFDWARDDLVAPINVDGQGMDDIFAYDWHSQRGAVYRADYVLRGRPAGFTVDVLQSLEPELSCPPTAIATGDFNGDGLEDGIILAPTCGAGGAAVLHTFHGQANGDLSDTPTQLELGLKQGVFTLEVRDLDGGGHDDLVVAESGQILVLPGSPNGLGDPNVLPVSPREVMIEGPAHLEDSERPLLTLAIGQLDPGSEFEVLVSTSEGISAISLESGLVGVFTDAAGSFGAFDINGDGVADVAGIVDGRVFVYRSSP